MSWYLDFKKIQIYTNYSHLYTKVNDIPFNTQQQNRFPCFVFFLSTSTPFCVPTSILVTRMYTIYNYWYIEVFLLDFVECYICANEMRVLSNTLYRDTVAKFVCIKYTNIHFLHRKYLPFTYTQWQKTYFELKGKNVPSNCWIIRCKLCTNDGFSHYFDEKKTHTDWMYMVSF